MRKSPTSSIYLDHCLILPVFGLVTAGNPSQEEVKEMEQRVFLTNMGKKLLSTGLQRGRIRGSPACNYGGIRCGHGTPETVPRALTTAHGAGWEALSLVATPSSPSLGLGGAVCLLGAAKGDELISGT